MSSGHWLAPAYGENTARAHHLTVAAAVVATTAGSFINYVGQNGYPLLSVLVLGTIVLSIPFAVAVSAAARTRLGLVAAAFLIGSVAYAFNNTSGSWAKYGVVAGAVLAIFVAWWGVRVLGFFAVAFAAIAVTSPLLADPFIEKGKQVEGDRDLPPFIHLILDEHGPGGFEEFAHWPNAYSRHLQTTNSIPEIFDGYPERLREAGYAVEIWQPGYIDFCDSNCTVYQQGTFANLHQLELHEQFQVLAESFGRHLAITRGLMTSRTMPSTLNGKLAFDEFISRARSVGRGEALIFHALLPHYPYVFSADCRINPIEEWARTHAGPDRQAKYEAQRACTELLARQAFVDDAIILVHGDHGTRILDRPLTDSIDPTEEELRAGYGTLFALRSDGVEGDDAAVSVSSLIDGWLPGQIPTGERETIFLSDRHWIPRREVDFP